MVIRHRSLFSHRTTITLTNTLDQRLQDATGTVHPPTAMDTVHLGMMGEVTTAAVMDFAAGAGSKFFVARRKRKSDNTRPMMLHHAPRIRTSLNICVAENYIKIYL